MITYQDTVVGLVAEQLNGFFVGWPNPPGPAEHLRILRGSSHVWIALDDTNGQVAGFINALSDGVLSAYIPLLEVLPAYQGRGIGHALVERMLHTLHGLYAIDLVCDPELVAFYARFHGTPYQAVIWRDRAALAPAGGTP
jgi:ribosomal protein S18 acetylase RimI-like enzyme